MERDVDEWIEQGLSQREQFQQLVEKNAIKVHKVFVQSEAGAELLATWKEQLVMVPTVRPGIDQFEAGINEGIKMLVRNIILQCQQFDKPVEKDQ